MVPHLKMIEKHVKICRDLRMNLVAIFQKNIMIQKLDILVFSLGKKPKLRTIHYQDNFPREQVELATSIQRSLIVTSKTKQITKQPHNTDFFGDI